MKKVNPIPAGYHTVNPYMMTRNVTELVTFLEKAFNGEVQAKTVAPNGFIMNVEMKIGTSMLMLAEARGDFDPMPMSFYMYVDDVDTTYQQALDAGAELMYAPADQFYGNRDCGVKGPKGNIWFIASHIEALSEAEITERMLKGKG